MERGALHLNHRSLNALEPETNSEGARGVVPPDQLQVAAHSIHPPPSPVEAEPGSSAAALTLLEGLREPLVRLHVPGAATIEELDEDLAWGGREGP